MTDTRIAPKSNEVPGWRDEDFFSSIDDAWAPVDYQDVLERTTEILGYALIEAKTPKPVADRFSYYENLVSAVMGYTIHLRQTDEQLQLDPLLGQALMSLNDLAEGRTKIHESSEDLDDYLEQLSDDH